MTQPRLLRCALMLLLASVPTLAACHKDSVGPTEIIIPPDLVQRQVVGGKVNICAVGPAGDYTFTVTRQGGVTGGTLLVDPTFTVAAGECRDVWVATPTDRNPDPATTVTITASGHPADAVFDHISAAATNNDRDFDILQASIVFRVNVYHGGAVSVFYKVATR